MELLKIGSRGNDVRILQSILKKYGYYYGNVDGIFGPKTKRAVLEFQNDFGLVPDGIAGPNTYGALEPFYLGYARHTINGGDTLYKIAKEYSTSVDAILAANPNIEPRNLMIGSIIIVPLGADVVLSDVGYTYDVLEMNLKGLKARYPFIKIRSAGSSVLGRNLYYIKIGEGEKEVFYNAAHHSLEWINAPVLMKFAEEYLKAYTQGRKLRGYDVKRIYEDSTMFIMPMVNPDGVDLVINGITPDNPYYNQVINSNKTSKPLGEVWNANIRGVDLNRNYPASWLEAKNQEESLGITGPGPTRYGGPYPLSEPETQAVARFTSIHDFGLAIAYHTQGEVIYWNYLDMAPPNALPIAQEFSALTGYAVLDNPYEAAYAGYKDWFIKIFGNPGYTFETGRGKNPLPIWQFNKIYDDNVSALLAAPSLIE